MKVTVNISLKEGVLDPQGRAVEKSLSTIGFTEASNVRIGKQITLDVEGRRCRKSPPKSGTYV